jgi:beta-glucanase (GH16 family)
MRNVLLLPLLPLLSALVFLSACGGASEPVATDTADTSSNTPQDTTSDVPPQSEAIDAPDDAREASAGLVPVATSIAYAVDSSELLLDPRFEQQLTHWSAVTGQARVVASELRSGGRALDALGSVTQAIGATRLQPGRSYTLKVTARLLSAGQGRVAVRLREAAGGSYRTYACSVTSTSYRECRVDFTAPAYAQRAALLLQPAGATLRVDRASLTMRSPIVQTETVDTLVGSTVPPGYALVFNDEFNGGALKRSKWFTRYINDNETADRLNDEQQRYRDNGNHVLANGLLSLTARKVRSGDPAGINYESGMLRSDFTFRYGYVEARVRMPGGRGVWPAFWLASDADGQGHMGWPPEIDIFEVVNNGVEDTMDMLHTNVVKPAGTAPAPHLYMDAAYSPTWTYWRAPYRFNDGWHTVAVEWTPDRVSTFVDGRRVVTRAYNWTRSDGTPAGPAHLLLNLAVGGSWAGRHGVDDSAFPQSLQVNWVRVYQKSNPM